MSAISVHDDGDSVALATEDAELLIDRADLDAFAQWLLHCATPHSQRQQFHGRSTRLVADCWPTASFFVQWHPRLFRDQVLALSPDQIHDVHAQLARRVHWHLPASRPSLPVLLYGARR